MQTSHTKAAADHKVQTRGLSTKRESNLSPEIKDWNMFASEQIWIKTVLDLKCFKIGLVLMLNVKKYIFCLFTRNLHRASCCGILLRSVTCGQIFQSMPLTQD